MGPDFSKAILDLSFRMRLIRAMQEEQASSGGLTERDLMILELLAEHGEMTVSEIAASCPNVSTSTISTNITRLWRDRILTKTINPENQRITTVTLTEKGKKAVDIYNQQRTERFQRLFEAINVTDDEKVVFLNIINRAVKAFDKQLGLDKRI